MYLKAPPNGLDAIQQRKSMAIYVLCIERGAGIISICPYASIVLPRVNFQLIGKEVAKPDTVRFGVLPCLCRPAIESMKDEDSR